MTADLQGSRAVVTGAARGIGEATARRFCEEGARVVLTDRDGDAVEAAAETLRMAGHEAYGQVLDVTDDAGVQHALAPPQIDSAASTSPSRTQES